MRWLENAMQEQASSRENHFLTLRLLAASLVILGHSFYLSPKICSSCKDPFLAATGYASSHIIGVQIFFVLSGFLVHKSFDTQRNLGSYFRSRARRILPAYLICIVLMVFPFGAFFTSLELTSYLHNREVVDYLLGKWIPWTFTDHLPQVVFSERSLGSSINGSLWTIPLEISLYLLLALLGSLRLLSSPKTGGTTLFFLLLSDFGALAFFPLEESLRTPLQLGFFFLWGGFLYAVRKWVLLHPVCWAACILLGNSLKDLGYAPYFYGMGLGYGVLLIAYAKHRPIKMPDISYGTYLYAFPIQQALAFWQKDFGPYRLFLLALPLSMLLGWCSWHLIEAPFLKRPSKLPSPTP